MPDPKSAKVGVWENDKYIGCIIFSRGVGSTNISKTLKIKSIEIVELSRVALANHDAPVTRIIAIAIRIIKKQFPKLKILVSYADENHGHLGVIYQAGGWVYTGKSAAVALYKKANGEYIHDRACSSTGYKRQFGAIKKVPNRKDLTRIEQLPKWRYMMPLDPEMKKQIEHLRKPYPKRAGSIHDAPAHQAGEGGEAPTPALQSTL
jgi:hypothetical protein